MSPVHSTTGKILVVDDEETMRRTLAEILRLEGYQVQSAASGEAAIDALRRDSFDLLLLDLKMPGMDGMEVLKIATRIAPETMVIFLTAHGSLESAIEALRQEAFDYLLKPATPQQVISSVERALTRQAEAHRKRILLETLDASVRELRSVEHRQVVTDEEEGLVGLAPGVTLDLSRREIWQVQDESGLETVRVRLTPAEGKLLKVLLDNAGRVLSHRDLVQQVQGYDVGEWEAPEVLRPLVSRLRQKLGRFPGGENWVISVRGSGYVFDRRR